MGAVLPGCSADLDQECRAADKGGVSTVDHARAGSRREGAAAVDGKRTAHRACDAKRTAIQHGRRCRRGNVRGLSGLGDGRAAIDGAAVGVADIQRPRRDPIQFGVRQPEQGAGVGPPRSMVPPSVCSSLDDARSCRNRVRLTEDSDCDLVFGHDQRRVAAGEIIRRRVL